MKRNIRIASFIFAMIVLLQVPGCVMKMESACTEADSSEFMDFMPSSGARSVVTTITLPVVGMSTIVRFDDSIDYQEAEYETSNSDVVVAYDRRILARGVGTATVTITVGELCQVVNVVVGNNVSEPGEPTQEPFTNTVLDESEELPEQSYFFPEGQLNLSAEIYPVPPDQDNPGWMYTVDQVEMRAFSHTDAPVVRTIENRVVQVLAAVRFDNEDWVLIFSPYADTLYASIGWVLGSDLCEQSDMTEIEYPVKLKAGAVDMITGEEIVFNEDYLFWAHDYTDENVRLSKSGEGKDYLVPLEDVLFPRIVDAELIFE